jgi:predicted nuclease with TOPRIM domain
MSNTNNIILENNSLKHEIMNLHTKMNSMEEQLQQITKTNTKLENELSKIMPYLTLFADNVSYQLHHIKNK